MYVWPSVNWLYVNPFVSVGVIAICIVRQPVRMNVYYICLAYKWSCFDGQFVKFLNEFNVMWVCLIMIDNWCRIILANDTLKYRLILYKCKETYFCLFLYMSRRFPWWEQVTKWNLFELGAVLANKESLGIPLLSEFDWMQGT